MCLAAGDGLCCPTAILPGSTARRGGVDNLVRVHSFFVTTSPFLGTTSAVPLTTTDPTTPDDSTPDLTIEEATETLWFLTESALRVMATVVGAIVVALLLRYLIHRMTARMVQAAEPIARFGRVTARTAHASVGAGLADRRTQRADTLNSILGSSVNVVVGLIAVVMVMQQLGWDIGPLIASAGIVGVAVGFGAQSLVKDILSGIFMMLEDQYGVGDRVDLGGTTGTVEAVALRVTRIRGDDGTLWFCRNGEILRVGNHSQGWARAVVDVKVGPDANLDAARTALVAAANAVADDEAFEGIILGEPSVVYVETIAASGTQLRVTLNTDAGGQEDVASELRRRIVIALYDAGVKLAD